MAGTGPAPLVMEHFPAVRHGCWEQLAKRRNDPAGNYMCPPGRASNRREILNYIEREDPVQNKVQLRSDPCFIWTAAFDAIWRLWVFLMCAAT